MPDKSTSAKTGVSERRVHGADNKKVLTLMTLMTFAAYEQPMKWVAFVLGLGSAICVVQGWQLAAMLCSLPFCLIWIYCGWLRSEPQLKYINVLFTGVYVYGLTRYWLLYV
ncbi:MAG: peptidase [Cognatishimia sp.]